MMSALKGRYTAIKRNQPGGETSLLDVSAMMQEPKRKKTTVRFANILDDSHTGVMVSQESK